MALSGKLIGYVDISSGGDVFHDVLRHKSHELASILHDMVHDGEKKKIKQIIEAVDEKKHLEVIKAIGGYLLEDLYKSFTSTFHVEPKGDGKLAIWTFEFEKQNANVPNPTSLMDFVCNVGNLVVSRGSVFLLCYFVLLLCWSLRTYSKGTRKETETSKEHVNVDINDDSEGDVDDSEGDAEQVDNETANFMASKQSGSGSGYGP
ncbi:bet v I/Major latex protein, START-like domain protein [Artemisia annua]|uniref:Bet v I/Major latex protein, START-like domain protein n=1 Tax=Artemisia annua TaxID=35608 RepID=A0A2U1L5V0_ARTAN|nr:bet v I/Major latex protein, START-like domain protein [Artemisia annua]